MKHERYNVKKKYIYRCWLAFTTRSVIGWWACFKGIKMLIVLRRLGYHAYLASIESSRKCFEEYYEVIISISKDDRIRSISSIRNASIAAPYGTASILYRRCCCRRGDSFDFFVATIFVTRHLAILCTHFLSFSLTAFKTQLESLRPILSLFFTFHLYSYAL